MDKAYLMDQLVTALTMLSSREGTIEKNKECPSSEFVVQAPCYAAFFSVVESSDSLGQIYDNAEKEIEGLMSKKGGELPRDLELVLLVAGDQPPNPAVARRIADDRYVCRKFVLWPDGRKMEEVLADLPFWQSYNLLSEAPSSVAAGIQEAVGGFDPRLIADLASHRPGVERIVEKVREGIYSLTSEISGSKVVSQPRVAPSVQTKLEGLDITDFRGIRCLRAQDLPLSGDVVFIYGPNGVGKTSIADALEWAITGQVNRLEQVPHISTGGDRDPIFNVFSDAKVAQVTCHLSNCEPVCRIKRGRLTERLIGTRGARDDRAVIDYVVGTKAPSQEARLQPDRLRNLFRSSHMLSQHDIRQFLQRTAPRERFDILTNMIGAMEFVRFKEKVAAVLRHLRTEAGAMAEQCKALNLELQDLTKRLRDRQKEFEALSHAVTSGKNPEDLASELLHGLRSCQCTLDDAAIERASSKTAEHRLEFIAIHTETVIRSKKGAIEDLLVRLKSLDQEVQGYVESQVRCQNLRAEIASTKRASEEAQGGLAKQEKSRQDIQASLQVLKTKQAEVTGRYADLTWLKENQSAFHQSRETLRLIEDSLPRQHEEIQRVETDFEDQQNSLSGERARLQEIEQTLAAKTNREQALITLLKRLPYIQNKQQEAEELSDKERQFDAQMEELKRRASLAREEVNAAQAGVEDLQRGYNSESAHHDVLTSFLAKISELVHSAECPLCGRGFATTEEAKKTIQGHLAAVPLQMKNLARLLDEAKKNAEAKQAQVDSIAAEIRALGNQLEEVRSSRTVALKEVHDFVGQCASVSIIVPVADTVSWQKTLEEAAKECEVATLGSEAASLRNAINSSAPLVAGQQGAIDGLRRKITQDENQRLRLATEITKVEKEMVQRGFEPGSLPQDDQLAAGVTKAQDEARGYGKLVAEKEGELRVIESAIEKLRERLRIANEDVASKETQLRQYETTCSRFAAACRAIGIDPENPKESITVVKQKTLEQNQFLSGLEEKRQVLQQVVSLGKLKLEIDSLARTENDLKRRAEVRSCEDSRFHDWVSHIERLEAEVVRRQVDVVGTHLKGLEPTTQRLYQRLNPHPIFGNVKIRVNQDTQELDVEANASVARDRLGDDAFSPSAFFSDAQMNSLAITVFLAGALRQRWSGFNTILIDDPVQQMDEMNVCAFLDLIRGLSSRRQFIIFTCSRDFYLLAIDKLVCLNKSKRGGFLGYRLEGIAPAELKVHCDAP